LFHIIDPESLLRYGLPIDNKDARDLQASIENVKNNIKARRINFAKGDVNNAKDILNNRKDKLLSAAAAVGHGDAGKAALQKMSDDVIPLEAVLSAEGAFGTGSVQQRTAYDDAFTAQDVLARDLSVFEQLLVPDNFRRNIPSDYKGLPALQGRAIVDMTIKKADGSQYDVDGKLYDNVCTMVNLAALLHK
jgi:peptidylprolyl isomerase